MVWQSFNECIPYMFCTVCDTLLCVLLLYIVQRTACSYNTLYTVRELLFFCVQSLDICIDIDMLKFNVIL